MAYSGTRRTVFISFHQGDRPAVDAFIGRWADREEIFIPKALGISMNDEFIDSDNPEYVMGRVREKYLGDSTVTIVLIGTCTHSRRYVDWEIKSSLRRGEYTPNGLLGILLPGLQSAHLPERFEANWEQSEASCYARYRPHPASPEMLGSWIDDAFKARLERANLIKNESDMMKYNARCKVCGVTH